MVGPPLIGKTISLGPAWCDWLWWPNETLVRIALSGAPYLASLCAPGDDLFMTESPEQLHIRFQDAFNRHDLDSIVALYEPGAVLARFGGPVRGTDAIRQAYRDALAMRPTIDVQTLGVNRAGDLAMLHGKWILDGTGPDGVQIHREGRNTETARLQPDGRWLFVIDNPSAP
jgi:ketosteroid isomerase-like protein